MLIVADDLTGAADCGVACAVSGLKTLVLLDGDANRIDADVIAVDADSRRMSAVDAAEITGQIVRERMRGPQRILYKKLDSTLRGNVGVEVAAALKAFRNLRAVDAERQRGVVVVSPAFPKNGRTTFTGRQFLDGVPLEGTEIWKREEMRGTAYIPEILRMSGLRADLVALSAVRSGRDGLRSRMMELRQSTDAIVCDAETDEDLYSIATASVSVGPGVMWAGSAGLAHHLPRAAGLTSDVRTILDDQPIAAGPTLFVVGSLSSASREQVGELAWAGDVRSVCVSPAVLRAGMESFEWGFGEREIRDAVRSGNDVLVHLQLETEVDMTQGRLLSIKLAKLVASVANEVGGLVLTGGETAREALKALGVTGLRLLGELEPGLPLSMAESWARRLPVLTKAGDFGNPQSLVHCCQYLRQLDRSRYPANFW